MTVQYLSEKCRRQRKFSIRDGEGDVHSEGGDLWHRPLGAALVRGRQRSWWSASWPPHGSLLSCILPGQPPSPLILVLCNGWSNRNDIITSCNAEAGMANTEGRRHFCGDGSCAGATGNRSVTYLQAASAQAFESGTHCDDLNIQ